MRIVSVLVTAGLIAAAPFSTAIAGSRAVAVNACKASIVEKFEGQDVKLSLGKVRPSGGETRFFFKVRYTNDSGDRVKTNAECVATRKGEVLSLDLV